MFLPTFAFISLFNFSHLSGYGVVYHCGFDLTNDIEHLFMCLLAICVFSLVKHLDPLPILN